MKSHWLIIIFIGLSLPTTAYSEIYKWVDKQGIIHYSDTPSPGATPVNLPTPQSYQSSTPAKPDTSPSEVATPTHQYESLKIVKPLPEDTVRNNLGEVDVIVSLNPPLQAGDKLVILLDGKPAGEPQTTLGMTLQNIDRGTHQLQIQAIDMQGKVLITSEPVTFFMHRAFVKQNVGPSGKTPPQNTGTNTP